MSRPDVAGIVLCGGKSSRMGRPKALLPFGREVMLQRVVRILQEVVTPIVVVAARDQELPPLPDDVIVVRDEYDSLGPLAGLAAGLPALPETSCAAYVSSCDVPLLKPAFVQCLVGALDDYDVVIPRDKQFHHPLAAVYRRSTEPVIRELLVSGRLRPYFLLEQVRAREIDVANLRNVDPDLQSLRNLNTPEEYAAALRDAGLE